MINVLTLSLPQAAGEDTLPSYTKSLLDDNEANGGGHEGEELIASTAGTLFAGASFRKSVT